MRMYALGSDKCPACTATSDMASAVFTSNGGCVIYRGHRLLERVLERARGPVPYDLGAADARAGAAEAEVALHEEVEGLLAEEGGEVGAVGVDVAAGFDADGVEFALEDALRAFVTQTVARTRRSRKCRWTRRARVGRHSD